VTSTLPELGLPQSTVAGLLAAAGLPVDFMLHPVSGGANNRVFRVDLGDGRRVLLKRYFHHPGDQRDRLSAEFAFTRFAWAGGIRTVPEPLACDAANRLGLYAFIEGRRLRPGEITAAHVTLAADFLGDLRRLQGRRAAAQLPSASEACFSVAGHLGCVEQRINRLLGIEETEGTCREAREFVEQELAPTWKRVSQAVRAAAVKQHMSLDDVLAPRERCLSPSDVGFHNALLPSDGKLHFLDFEYAGWDDPAKLVCDFFCQVEVSVPQEHYDVFVQPLLADASRPEQLAGRIGLLFPVYRVKWCCILLNEFVASSRARRRFSEGGADQTEREEDQLQKARLALSRLVDEFQT